MTLVSLKRTLQTLALLIPVLLAPMARATALPLPDEPLFTSYTASPIVMLDISRDHQLFYKAYNDYTDLNGNGALDAAETTFDNSFLYYGYFDPTKCYTYSTDHFEPQTVGGGTTAPSSCITTATTGSGRHKVTTTTANWSGNFLNWVSMSRLDIMRKVLFGGLRSSDSADTTVLERAAIPTDGHSWAKYYSGTDIGNYTPFSSATTFCNTTYAANGKSQDTTAPPLLRRAPGDKRNWAAKEGHECVWDDPQQPDSASEFTVKVKVCVTGKIGTENCKSYDGTNYKPVGLLQKFGERARTTADARPRIYFGLMTGSYSKNVSGGVLRKAATLALSNTGDTSKDEITASNGTFTGNDGIIKTISKLRMYGYNYDSGFYFNGGDGSDSCYYQQTGIVIDGSGSQGEGVPANEGNCASWGNPMSEVYIESLRYLAGKSKTSAFDYSSGPDARVGLADPVAWGSGPLNKDNYCSPLNVLMFNASVSSFDDNQAIGPFASLKDSPDLNKWTDDVGNGEGITSHTAFVGRIGGSAADEGKCTAKTITHLSTVSGICPESPSLYGSYFMAGAAYFAHTKPIRDHIADASDSGTPYTVKTYAVQMATNVPRIKIPGTGVVLQPAYLLDYGNKGSGTIVDFRILSAPTANYGKFEVVWEDSNQGGDYDQDIKGTIEYTITGTTLTVTTQINLQSTGHPQGFGYTISGTNKDGPHFHSGIYGFTYTDPTGAKDCHSGCSDMLEWNSPAGPETTATYTIGATSTALVLQDPMFYAAKWGGFDTSSATTPATASSWDKQNNTTGANSADGLPDNYFYVTNPGILEASLDRALSGISDTTSGSAAAASSSTLQTGTKIYQAVFTPKSWIGDLIAYSIDSTTAALTKSWSAASSMASVNAGTRVVLTTTTTTTGTGATQTTTRNGVAFRWASLSDSQKTALGYDASVTGSETTAQSRLNYLRGDATNEGTDSSKFRVRSVKLGDIVDSTPVYVGKPAGQYTSANRFLNAYVQDSTYTTFRTGKLSRTPVVYVGANDGMLHGFSATSGAEVLAYVPGQVYGAIASLSNQDYNGNHKFSVNGTPEVADAQIGTAWKTVLVSGLRKGGKGIFALDVSDPSLFAEDHAGSIALFEFLASDDPGNDMGYVYGSPVIAKMASGQWAAIFGNGYNSGNERPVVYIVFLKSGSSGWAATDFVKLTVPATATGSNGMGPVSVFDKDLDGIADTIYAGDLNGNVWKFDVSSTTSSSWALASNGSPLARATDSDGNARPITNAPAVTWHPNDTSTTLVYFGSGRYLVGDDVSSTQTDTMYGVWDNNSTSGITRASLQSQSIGSDTPRTMTTNVAITWGTDTGKKMGWFEDLPGSGERVTGTPTVLGGTVFYNTFQPNKNICDCGGTGYLMAVSYLNGSTTSGIFTGLNTSVVGIQVGGVLGGSTILPPGSSDTGVAVSNTTKPSDPTQPKPVTTKLSGAAFGGTRLSWRELIRK